MTATKPVGSHAESEFGTVKKTGDIVSRGIARFSAIVITAIVLVMGLFLTATAVPSLQADTVSFLTSRTWIVRPDEMAFGIAGMLWTTIVSSAIALLLAVPLAIGISLCITQLAPKRLATPIAFLVDLLAAVPSVIFGLWGLIFLAPTMNGVVGFLSSTLGTPNAGFPQFIEFILTPVRALFAPALSTASGTVMLASVVLAIMILPIITAIMRDVFMQTPRDHIEAALALGATRWEVIRLAVLPYGRSGMTSASMLGLGRALGETVAVMILLSATAPDAPWSWSIFDGGTTFAAKIALSAAEFDTPLKTGAYVAAALVLFILTFIVNALARMITMRGVK